MATTIASQALISGVFSLTHQAVQLGYFPRVTVNHTSREAEGQIYVPLLNWGLLVACIGLVVGFKESARLASAYGIAVSGTMAITSVVFFDVTRKTWKWPLAKSLPLLILFLSFDIPFFAANLTKFLDGGYIPVLVGVVFFGIMVNWHQGREALMALLDERTIPVPEFLRSLPTSGVNRVPGTAIYLSPSSSVPFVLVMQAKRLRALAEHVLLVTVVVEHAPQVTGEQRFSVERLEQGFVRMVLRFGYMENPDVPPLIHAALDDAKHECPLDDATYYIGRETFVAGKGGRMQPMAEAFFALLSRNAKSAIDHFALPSERVVELGIRVDL
jgi:KUP system potassium uptake protein